MSFRLCPAHLQGSIWARHTTEKGPCLGEIMGLLDGDSVLSRMLQCRPSRTHACRRMGSLIRGCPWVIGQPSSVPGSPQLR